MALRLTMGFTGDPRVQPLKDGTVKPENIGLEFVTVDADALFYRNLKYDEFDTSEMSISETLLTIERKAQTGAPNNWSAAPSNSLGTVSDLDEAEVIGVAHLAEALHQFC